MTDILTWSTLVYAVSSIFMTTELFTDFVLSDSIGASTEWMIGFPTKNYYTDPMLTGSEEALAPFTNPNGSCETAEINMRSRDADNFNSNVEFCFNTNVIDLTETNQTSTPILGSLVSSSLASEFETGGAQMIFSNSLSMSSGAINGNTNLDGLPTMGFAIQKYVNSHIDSGISANYAGILPMNSKTKSH